MFLVDRIREDLKSFLKNSEREKVDVVRYVLAQFQNKEKEKQAKGVPAALTDDEAQDVLLKEVKKRKDAMELFKKGGREDLVKKEEAELKIIGGYLPEEIRPEEINGFVSALIKSGKTDFNSLMKETMQKFKGRADGRVVADIVKSKLEEETVS